MQEETGNKEKVNEGCDAPTPYALREMTWDERTVDQKVEALRRVLIDLAFQFRADEKRVQSLMKHSHADGKIMVPFEKDVHVEMPYWAKSIQ